MQDKTLRKFLDGKAQRVNEEHRQVENALQSALSHAIHAGRLLMEVKAKLDHGEFLPWLEKHTAVSARTSQGYMRLARRQAELREATRENPSLTIDEALRLLARPKDELADEALTGAEAIKPALAAVLATYTEANAITAAHVQVLAGLESFYTPGILRDFSAFRDDPAAADPSLFANPLRCVCLLRDLRPEDVPVAWMVQLDGDDGAIIRSACGQFAAFIAAHDFHLPQWVVTGFWWATLAVYLNGTTADQLSGAVMFWRQRVLSAFASTWPGTSEQRADCDKEHPAMWSAYRSDLRHAGFPVDQLDGRDDRQRVAAVIEWEENARRLAVSHLENADGGFFLPSSMQPWAR